MSPRFTASLLATGVLLALPARAKDPDLPSVWRSAGVIVDGSAEDWTGKLTRLGSLPILAGVQNDGRFLYVCLETSDEATRNQLLTVGLSIFLDASGRGQRTFGIRFPVGRLGAERDVPDTGDAKTTKALGLSIAGAELEILGKDEIDNGRMRVSEARPIEAALGDENGMLVIELQVPLAFSVESPHAIDTQPGKTIALGLETAPPKRKKRAREDLAVPPPLGGSSMIGGPGSLRPFPPRGSRPAEEGERDVSKAYGKPLKAWMTVALATPGTRPAP